MQGIDYSRTCGKDGMENAGTRPAFSFTKPLTGAQVSESVEWWNVIRSHEVMFYKCLEQAAELDWIVKLKNTIWYNINTIQ